MENLSLIKGQFSATEAKEILTNIYLAKIRFHELKKFSSQVRFGVEDETAKHRIPELKEDLEKLLKITSEAEENNQQLIISSQIEIQLVDAEINHISS